MIEAAIVLTAVVMGMIASFLIGRESVKEEIRQAYSRNRIATADDFNRFVRQDTERFFVRDGKVTLH